MAVNNRLLQAGAGRNNPVDFDQGKWGIDGVAVTVSAAQINAAGEGGVGVLTKDVWVSNEGTDTVGFGSMDQPYQTINFALSQITDNSSLQPYTINLTTGIYTVTGNLLLKPYVNFKLNNAIINVSGNVQLDPSWDADLSDGVTCYFSEGTLTAVAYIFDFSSFSFDYSAFFNFVGILTDTSTITLTGKLTGSTNQTLSMHGAGGLGVVPDVTLTNSKGQFSNVNIGNFNLIGNTAQNIDFIIDSSLVQGNISITNSGAGNSQLVLFASLPINAVSINGVNASLMVDSSSFTVPPIGTHPNNYQVISRTLMQDKNLSDLTDKATANINLGSYGPFATENIPAGDDMVITLPCPKVIIAIPLGTGCRVVLPACNEFNSPNKNNSGGSIILNMSAFDMTVVNNDGTLISSVIAYNGGFFWNESNLTAAGEWHAVDYLTRAGVNYYVGITPFLVGLNDAPYFSIQGAIEAAKLAGASNTSPRLVIVKDGTYSEDIIIYDGIYLCSVGSLNPLAGAFTTGDLTSNVFPTVELTGNVTLDVSGEAHNTLTHIKGIFINPAGGNAFELLGAPANAFSNLLTAENCRVQVTEANKYIFNVSEGGFAISAVRSFLFDNTAGNTAQLLQGANDATCTIQLFLDHCNTLVSQGAVANTFNANTNILIRVMGGNMGCSFDATNCASYFFRGFEGLVHYNNEVINVVPYHTVGAATTGRIVYSPGCAIQGAVGVNIATIDASNSVFEWQDSGVTYGGIGFGASNSIVSGGLQTRDCLIRTATGTYNKQLDLNRVGFSGSSEIIDQEAVQTTDATVTTLASVVVNEGEAITLKGFLVGAQADHTNAIGGDFLITARRQSGGNITLVGAVYTNVNTSSTATFTCDVDTGTQAVRLRITGVAATTYNWVTTYSYQKILTNA